MKWTRLKLINVTGMSDLQTRRENQCSWRLIWTSLFPSPFLSPGPNIPQACFVSRNGVVSCVQKPFNLQQPSLFHSIPFASWFPLSCFILGVKNNLNTYGSHIKESRLWQFCIEDGGYCWRHQPNDETDGPQANKTGAGVFSPTLILPMLFPFLLIFLLTDEPRKVSALHLPPS